MNYRNRCLNCQEMFSSHRSDAKCCSAKCRKAVQRKRDKGVDLAVGVTKSSGHSYDQEAARLDDFADIVRYRDDQEQCDAIDLALDLPVGYTAERRNLSDYYKWDWPGL